MIAGFCSAHYISATQKTGVPIMLEKNIQDILNAGIGLFKSGEENFKTALGNVEKTFEELKARGEGDNSEAAVKIREVLENTIRSIKEVTDKTESNFSQVLDIAQRNYQQVLEQITKLVGEERVRDLNARMEELAEYIKKTTGTVQPGGATATGAAAESEKPTVNTTATRTE